MLACRRSIVLSAPFRVVRRVSTSSLQLGHDFLNSRKKSGVAFGNYEEHHDEESKECPQARLTTTRNPIPDFHDARTTFENKSTSELLRAATCFQACKIPLLVENAEGLLRTSRQLFGGRIVNAALKATFYGQFCAGEDERGIQPVVEKLNNAGVGAILDYAAENDDPVEGVVVHPGNRSGVETLAPGSKTAHDYDYRYETQCDQHVLMFLQCINDVSATSKGGENHGYAAIKLTALGNPNLLARLSTAIVETKRLFSIFDTNGDGFISRDEFETAYNHYFVDGDERIEEIFLEFDPLDTGFVDYIAWSTMFSTQDLPEMTKNCQAAGRLSDACPTDEEIDLLNAMWKRCLELGKEAAKIDVRLLFDAEQVRYQPAIDNIVVGLQRRFNVGDKPIIYNTYQCYLRDTPERLRTDAARSERFGYHFGAKVVRGAYMESERELSALLNQEGPIHPTIEETHKCYNDSVEYIIRHSSKSNLVVEVMCATHNETSIVKAIESMNSHGIDRMASTVSFAQLYGMSDKLVSS
eukprot:CAMPEP_0201145436 /NCGR_PEP_ID=MMETSP0851-20130426/7154_1 /ASSEMBLY_ACC=CAM_ASM_000631 /TAXON_ID=183588 /ORGANISM="Pseudo-nitzschia fraudulenta, Strain WWA7" /LENGTH=525 /DNA_ID=CAMNT_0047420587 /DNA_START=85 /DNA_END=1662 /DNA_ORIENTATION=+